MSGAASRWSDSSLDKGLLSSSEAFGVFILPFPLTSAETGGSGLEEGLAVVGLRVKTDCDFSWGALSLRGVSFILSKSNMRNQLHRQLMMLTGDGAKLF
jgi:hypothetical protein